MVLADLLGHQPEAGAQLGLEKLLVDSNPVVRRLALLSLARLTSSGPKSSSAQLTRAAQDSDEGVRQLASMFNLF